MKYITDYQEFTWNVVNSIKIKLKFKIIYKENKNNTSNNNAKNQKEKTKQYITQECRAATMVERTKYNNNKNTKGNNNDNSNPFASGDPTNKPAPKKLVINPSLYDKDGKIKIISSKMQDIRRKNYESSVQNYLYGDDVEEDFEENRPNIKNDLSDKNKKDINFKKNFKTVEAERSKNQKIMNGKKEISKFKGKDGDNQNKAQNNDDAFSRKPVMIMEKMEQQKTEENQDEINNDDKMRKKRMVIKHRNLSADSRKITNDLKQQNNIPNENNQISLEEILRRKREEYCNVESVNYTQYIKKSKMTKNKEERETFCEGFFIASFPCQNAQVIENSQSFPSACGHQKCSVFNAMKPEIIMRYPLEDTKNLELNNLAATICFPTGIKVCYNEEPPTNMIDDYLTSITNQKGERYYMMTFHFYQKITNSEYSKKYEMHPLKNHLMKFGDSYSTLNDQGFTDKIVKKVQETLDLCEELGFRDYVYVPFCLCIISKYPYAYEMTRCLQSIFNILSEEKIINNIKTNFKMNDIIMYLINSVPIPIEKNTRVKFYIPFFQRGIALKYPKLDEISIVNINYMQLLQLFPLDNFIIILRLLLLEKKILFIDDNYTRLSEVTDAFLSLLYPFKWVHTYIPIMSDQMIKYLETFLPFVNGIHLSLMSLVNQVFNNGEIDDSEEVFLIYIKEGKIDLSSSVRKKKKKLSKYIQTNVPALPSSIEKQLRTKLAEIKGSFGHKTNEGKRLSIATRPVDPTQYDKKIRDACLQMFVEMFKDYPRFICIVDNDVIFNKNSFMNTVNKNDKKFFDEFIDSQMFQQFTQCIFNDECSYFNKIISTEGETNNESSGAPLAAQRKKVFLITPDYLGTKKKENSEIEDFISETFPTNSDNNFIAKYECENSDGIILPSYRVIPSVKMIKNEDYNNDQCLIYLLPNQFKVSTEKTLLRDTSKRLFENIKNQKKNTLEVQTLRQSLTKTNLKDKDELKDKEKEEIREMIKDCLKIIFRSENINYNDPKNKTEMLNILKNPFGREFFISLLSSNLKNVVLLQQNSFSFLGFLIYNVLVESLQVAETDKLLGEIYLLIKSTMYFGVEHKKKTKTLFEDIKSKIRDYPIINQKRFWNTWFEKELDTKKDKGNSTKQTIILNICSKMIELEIYRIVIKDMLDDLNDKVFQITSEMGQQTQKMYMKKITEAKYSEKK